MDINGVYIKIAAIDGKTWVFKTVQILAWKIAPSSISLKKQKNVKSQHIYLILVQYFVFKII